MAYHMLDDGFYHNQTVLSAAHLATAAWISHDFQNSNWWWYASTLDHYPFCSTPCPPPPFSRMEIGVPRLIARLLFLVNDAALGPPAAKLLDRGSVAQAMSMTACNRVWIASSSVLRSAFDGNLTRLGQAYAAIQSAIVVGGLEELGESASSFVTIPLSPHPRSPRSRPTAFRTTAASTSTARSCTWAGAMARSSPPRCYRPSPTWTAPSWP